MLPLKLMLRAAGRQRPSKQQFLVVDLETDLPLAEPLRRKVRVVDILRHIRVLGLFTPYADNPVLPRYPDNALLKDAERIGGYMKKAIGQYDGR